VSARRGRTTNDAAPSAIMTTASAWYTDSPAPSDFGVARSGSVAKRKTP
jgi:hypothetical protein